jgi:hypothetical protein
MTTPTGVTLALIKDSKTSETFFVRANQQILGFEVIEFSGDEISVRNRNGEVSSLKFGEVKALAVD